MATIVRGNLRTIVTLVKNSRHISQSSCRMSNTVSNIVIERHRKSPLSNTKEETKEEVMQVAPRDFKFVKPEFLPEPNWQHRDRIRELVERKDMLRRRSVMNIPEFYVGSIMAVLVSDQQSPKKNNRFVGICIDRGGQGLRAYFILRNIVDGQGVEIMYEMYNPTLQKIEVLKLEKRLDEQLYYLRDSPPEYSTVPFDVEKVAHPPGAPIPINTLKVPLNPRPWHERWERQNLKGTEPIVLPERFWIRAAHPQIAKPFEKYDLMKQYRESINDEETESIMSEVFTETQKLKKKRQRGRAMAGKQK